MLILNKTRRNISLLLLLVSTVMISNAQITVTDNDFADAGDTVRMSNAVWNPFIDYQSTGPQSVWDFSDLIWQEQYIDTFLNVFFTTPPYSFFFNNTPLNIFRSNIAKKTTNTLTSISLLSGTFTDAVNFYYKTSGSYRQRGIGMRVAGFPTAIPLMHSDTLYRFPMNYGNRDTAHSDFTVRVPNLGLYSHRQIRYNQVDGWGTLITPYGTFDVLRYVTELHGSDSLYIDTLNFGFRIDNDIQKEYQWIALNEKVPLLQISTQAGILGQFPNFEFVTKIVYRDSVRFLPTGVEETSPAENSFALFPNPAQNKFYVLMPEDMKEALIIVTDLNGKLVLERKASGNLNQVETNQWAKGTYLVSVKSDNKLATKKLIVE